jgi:colicin import membrane protein
METSWDKLRAVAFALGLHALVIALLFVGLLTQPVPASTDAEGPIVEATLVSSPQQSAAIAKAIKAIEQKTQQDTTPPSPQPIPEPKPPETPPPQQLAPQAPLPKPDTVDQEEVRRIAEQATAQKKLQEQEERRKQAQIDLTNKEQQQLAQQELERQKQLADIRKQRADAERQVKLDAQRLKQLQDQRAQLALNNTPPAAASSPLQRPPAGNNGKEAGLLAKYKQAIVDVTNSNWIHTDVPEQVHCKIRFTQIPGGDVIDVKFLDCPFDAAGRESVDRAMRKTPLPYAGFEPVFPQLRQWELDFCYPTEACTR